MVFRHECPQKEPLLAAERPTTLSPNTVGPDRGGGHLGCSPYGCPEPTGQRRGELRIKRGRWQTLLRHTAERYHLGKSTAPVTIYLYEDFQCPVCAQFSRKTFPEVVDRSVRGGEVKVV